MKVDEIEISKLNIDDSILNVFVFQFLNKSDYIKSD